MTYDDGDEEVLGEKIDGRDDIHLLPLRSPRDGADNRDPPEVCVQLVVAVCCSLLLWVLFSYSQARRQSLYYAQYYKRRRTFPWEMTKPKLVALSGENQPHHRQEDTFKSADPVFIVTAAAQEGALRHDDKRGVPDEEEDNERNEQRGKAARKLDSPTPTGSGLAAMSYRCDMAQFLFICVSTSLCYEQCLQSWVENETLRKNLKNAKSETRQEGSHANHEKGTQFLGFNNLLQETNHQK